MSGVTGKPRLPPGRYVTLQIQEKAIRYGIRTQDPLKKKPGFFRYKARMYKLVEDRKNKGTYS
ncbi:hypothetical protein [Enterobacter ludwigii]|uniref:hypothetical protein n=1 Tax=Enterobacter ludwigii TaxID=299767 RepID=UPI002B4BF0FC|nr:hypothetical protein [Enterobacter ludwigii]WRM02627.1 hypothetical protein Q5384_12260 [Enterobacter ludwigii]